MRCTLISSLVLSGLLALPLCAQDTSQTAVQQNTGSGPITLTTDRMQSIPAINYNARNGSTMIDFLGTNFQPLARGDAKIEARTGRISIKPKFVNLKPANTLGPEYLTYVLWAITPEGRPTNLGEVIPNDDGKAELTATTNLQTFGLMVTAEPYFAVTRPGARIILENAPRSNTKGVAQPIFAKFETLQGGDYVANLDPSRLPATGQDPKKTPLELLEARNAVAIARQSGADRYAPDAFRHASDLLANGEAAYNGKQGKTQIVTAARSAVQAAEDARLLTIRRQQEERAANERQAAQQQTQLAQQQAQQQAASAEQARAEAEAQRMAATHAQEQAMTAQQQAEQAAQERAIAEAARQQAEQEQQRALAQAQQAQVQAQSAQQRVQQVEQEREQMRSQLQQELNQVLQTRDTARGLIVNMSDVLFDTGQATLRPGARLRLAKVAGIMAAHPDLHLAIEGHTDNVGGDSYNQQLSDRRAEAVRTFLVSQGVPQQNVTAEGYGKTQPIASNDTAAGRQLNRRVDIVVSGESIQSARAGQPPAAGTRVGAGSSASTGGVGGSVGATGGVGATAPGSTGTVAQPTPQTTPQPVPQPQPQPNPPQQ